MPDFASQPRAETFSAYPACVSNTRRHHKVPPDQGKRAGVAELSWGSPAYRGAQGPARAIRR
jgi:hypothetical protein